MSNHFSRRQFFGGALAIAPLVRRLRIPRLGEPLNPRSAAACELRERCAHEQSKRSAASMTTNGDESSFPDWTACYAKGLPQNRLGDVQPTAYAALLKATESGKHADFERIPRGGGRKLSNPQSAFTFHLEGGDPHSFEIPPPPSVTSSTAANETSELYWQALCRDVPFSSYESSPVVGAAAKNLGATPKTVFRGSTKGDLAGPYISQFLLKPIPFGSGKIEQLYRVPVEGSDFMTTLAEWSQIQSGFPPWRQVSYDPTPRYIRTGRDLAEYAHYDFAYQAYLSAALILINSGPASVLNCNQFKSAGNPYRYSTVEEGFTTFGPAEVVDWLGRVTTAALKAAYYQKWVVHRRLRPEALGGLIHKTRAGVQPYPIHSSFLESEGVTAVFSRTGSYLLPQAYPEGCPLHPSYPAGHAAIAGACATVLKACFDSEMLLPGCVEPDPEGLKLIPCSKYSPTVADEVNKLAFNIAMGRNWAGIHFRSDAMAGLQLGEEVGISILQDLARTYTEEFKGFSFKRFDGTETHITPKDQLANA